MHMNQRKEFFEVTSYQNTKTKLQYLSRTWLGPLTTAISYKGLDLINSEYKHALAALPAEDGHRSTKEITALPPCDDDFCTVGLQFGIPCRHKIYQLLLHGQERVDYSAPTAFGGLKSYWVARQPPPPPEPRDDTPREEAPREEAAVEAPAPAPKRRGRPPKIKETAAVEAPAQPRKRGRPPKNKETAAPEPKRQRATPSRGPPAGTIGVGIASQGGVRTQVVVGATGKTTRSGRQVQLTKKAAEAGSA
ncbi:predicted protein [Chaetomium globosum CBS 148.51]|uniref:Uncharacterized protein n=1 Tax=Chaetomium globosum (strain ATCC 6205 / CBS 148.51 / DSM 1962 / NBRC 6347 / NRRL 1970) TaxID=306901 RepID=Q2HGK0_CHAGB|nr:uncharacterized protein CHGG_00654 [Chaetomium globosum CBS 148.51]EAQ92419.1 predicted protein [Chaetomium globosum CBS 148.51]